METFATNEIVTTRIVNFPLKFVFRVWSEPEHLKNWWGPNGFTNTFTVFEFKVGGKWSFVMHGPENGNYNNECEFTKIEVPTLIAWKRHSKPLFQVVAQFEEVDQNKTKVIFTMVFESEEECNKLKPFVVDKNEENFDKMEKELLTMLP
jgi:uncharacterized protein YndB with AHSA1/START domain